MRADDEVLEDNDEIDDDIGYDENVDQLLNDQYEIQRNALDFLYDCGIDLKNNIT